MAMSSARSKKQDSLQELRAGTVQRLSQQFLQASRSETASKPPSSPIRYQPLAIPHTFKPDNCLPPPSLPPPLPSSSSSTASSSSEMYSSSSISPLSSIRSTRGSTTSASGTTGVNQIRQQSAPQFVFRSTSPTINYSSPPPSSTSTLPNNYSAVGFINSKDLAGGLSFSSVGSEDSFVSALSYIDSPKEPGSPRTVPIWKQMLGAIEQEDRAELDRILHAFDFAIVIQTLVTWNLSNTDNKYRHDPDILLDAKELLGPTVDHLNLIQIACFLLNEEMALDMLNFVAKASEELESKKILYEFMGKMWGDGNTTLHLASFLGMADLTKRLLDLGANVYKMNDRKYKPVDCADENTTMSLFLNLTEVVRYRRIPQESLPTSPISDSGSELNWGSFRSFGHLRSPSTSTLPLLMTGLDDRRQTQNGERSNNSSNLGPLLRSASALGIASQLSDLSISESKHADLSGGLKLDVPKSGSVACIDGLLLTEPNPSQIQEEESILSPTVVSKSTALLNVSSIPESSSLLNSKNGDTGATISPTSNESTDPSDSRLPLQTIATNPTYASHIRPKLRSYQSSPSIRLCIKKSVAKESNAPSICKKSDNGKRVSFDPHSLMADASRTGDLALYKSMLEIVQQEGKSGTLEEIINHQSASRKLSSLHLAASYNHLALCKFLVEMGANINLGDMEGWTPMHCAAAEGHLKVFEFLVTEPDADLQATTLDGELLEDVVEDEELRQKLHISMTETLQAIYVRDYETRTEPKPHTVYRVEVHAAVRTWSVWKRYSEFEQLHERFEELFPDNPPPQQLPTKHWWQSTMDNPELLEERRAGLETYLRGILSHRDDRWRLTHEWNDFLAVPVRRSQADLFAGGPGVRGPATTPPASKGKESHAPSLLSHLNIFGFAGHGSPEPATEQESQANPVLNPAPAPHFFTTESWLEEFRTLQGIAREVRSLINRRETHLGRNEISASHNCTIQSKKLLTSLGLRIPALENGLMTLAMGKPGGGGRGSVMSDGELRRRQDLLSELKDEREVLTKLVIASRQNDGVVGYQGAGSNVPANPGDRNALLVSRGASSPQLGSHSQVSVRGNADNFSLAESTLNGGGSQMSGTTSSSRMPSARRVFGRVVQNLTQETSETRGLDNEGLLLMQQEQMKHQDDHIEQFNAILQRQKHIGMAIGQELDNQIQLLDELDRDVDRTTLKLGLVNKKIGKIN
ncbi:hypothetical protein BGX27_009924 [Mortierella sp. AM989]|nr:hypothetical protein BGX27_009924 [Mortierella sp. AM989]